MRLAFGAILAVVVSCAVNVSAQDTVAAQEEVRQAQLQRYKAQMARDVETLGRIVADELSYCHTSGSVEDKASYLNTVRSARLTWLSMVPEDMQVHVYGNAAVIAGRLRETIQSAGRNEPRDLVLRTIEVYVRRDGRWQLAAFQAAPIGAQSR